MEREMKYRPVLIMAAAFLAGMLASASSLAQEPDQSVMQFYLGKVDSVLSGRYLFNLKTAFSFNVSSVYYKTDYRAELKEIDTASYMVFYFGTKMDSFVIVDSAGLPENGVPDDLALVLPWKKDCRFYFFPNDTGAGDLSIGFNADSAEIGGSPSGHLTFDRNTYHIKTLAMHFRNYRGLKQLSLVYRFGAAEKHLALQSLEMHGLQVIFFGRTYFRRILRFSNYATQD
ncbi:MAG: hypothetical protein JSV44_09295 [Candidatus Zixiibacteriota bacterium]|nr:MAG: hypothetical protein JSV44_09295 [candidate division Zixibacteria bacterium]